MKISVLIISISILCSSFVKAQDESYWSAPFGGGGGFVPAWFLPNFDEINSQLNSFGTANFSKSGFFASGGGGFAYIGIINYLRVGGIGFSGYTSVKGIQNNYNKEAVYNLGFGGVTLEYTLPFIKDFGVSIGAILGGGSLNIELYQNSGNFNWNDIWNDVSFPNFPTDKISRSLQSNFFAVAPTLTVDVPFYRFFVFRIGGGYLFAFHGDWKADNDIPLINVPDKLNANSFFFQTGIYIGLFFI